MQFYIGSLVQSSIAMNQDDDDDDDLWTTYTREAGRAATRPLTRVLTATKWKPDHNKPVAVLCWGLQGAQAPKSCQTPQIFNWFYSNFA